MLIRGFALALAREPGLFLSLHGCEREEVLRLFPALEEALEAAGPSIFFAGRYDAGDVLGLMRLSGWVVVPSIWWENSPVVIQEARRAGVPLIVSDIGGMAEKVRPGLDGLHFRRGNAPDLARVLLAAAAPGRQEALAASQADSIGQEEFLSGLMRALTGGQGAIREGVGAAAVNRPPGES